MLASTLDVDAYPTAKPVSFANDEAGRSDALAALRKLHPTLIVVEATGGLETPMAAILAAEGLSIAVVNPRQVRDFAKALGILAKTDRVDAHVLARFGQAIRPEARPRPSQESSELAALLVRRRQLVDMVTAENNRLQSAAPRVAKAIRTHVVWMQKRLAEVDHDLDDMIRASPVWQHKAVLMGKRPANPSSLLDRGRANSFHYEERSQWEPVWLSARHGSIILRRGLRAGNRSGRIAQSGDCTITPSTTGGVSCCVRTRL